MRTSTAAATSPRCAVLSLLCTNHGDVQNQCRLLYVAEAAKYSKHCGLLPIFPCTFRISQSNLISFVPGCSMSRPKVCAACRLGSYTQSSVDLDASFGLFEMFDCIC